MYGVIAFGSIAHDVIYSVTHKGLGEFLNEVHKKLNVVFENSRIGFEICEATKDRARLGANPVQQAGSLSESRHSGAAGSIWGAPNFAPKECVAIYELAKEGKTAEAFDIFKRLWNVFDFLGKEGYAVSTKAAAHAAGIDLGAPRAPFSELEPKKLDELRKLVADSGLNYA